MRQISDKLDRIEQLLIQHKSVLSLNDLASYTGLSKSYIYKLTSKGEIPCYRPLGKHLFFDREEIDEWLKRNRNKTRSEIESEAATYVTLNQRS